MNMILVALLVCVIGLQVAVGQIIESGKCPKVKPVSYFDLTKNYERVYVYAAHDGPLYHGDTECIIDQVHAPYAYVHLPANDHEFYEFVYTREHHYPGGKVNRIKNTVFARHPDPEVLGKYEVKYDDEEKVAGELNVLQSTDTYNVIFYCKELPDNKHLSQAVVYTKTPSPSLADVAAIKSVLSKNGIDSLQLKTSKCPEHTHV